MQKRLYDNKPLNKLLVVNKPMFVSSNSYLNRIKREFRNKKAGFSGTLDPFACGCLIVAFGQYSKLFKYLQKTPKTYRATIWLGVSSESLDIENVNSINEHKKLDYEDIKNELNSLVGIIDYYPPKFSAKKIDGKRAYEMARSGLEVEMKKSTMNIYDVKLINYNHPFITFETTVSEGSYIRSLAQILLEKLDSIGTLSFLKRLNEGKFFYDNKKDLNPLDFMDIKKNIYTGTKEWFKLGKKISLEYLQIKESGEYLIVFDDFFSIIEILDGEVKYKLNRIMLK